MGLSCSRRSAKQYYKQLALYDKQRTNDLQRVKDYKSYDALVHRTVQPSRSFENPWNSKKRRQK